MLTVREIKDILQEEHISLSKRRGQNFLVDRWVQKRIIDVVDVKANDEILEIGPGLGALTEYLAQLAGQVIAVEKDRALARILQKNLSPYHNLQIICSDILQVDLGKFIQKKTKVVGNLPYYISTPIIGYLLEVQRQKIKEIFITVQDEVGKRLVASVGNKDYSAITILTRYFTKPKVLFSIPKRAFYPQPKVNSLFVHLHLLNKPSVMVNNQEQFFKVIRACFNQRRKTILNSLTHNLAKLEKNKIQRVLAEGGIDFQARPERLSIDEFASIEDIFYKRRIRLE